MKVDHTYINIPKKPAFEVNVGDEFESKNEKVIVSMIDVTENATYITVVNHDGTDTTYGSKIFMEKFKGQ